MTVITLESFLIYNILIGFSRRGKSRTSLLSFRYASQVKDLAWDTVLGKYARYLWSPWDSNPHLTALEAAALRNCAKEPVSREEIGKFLVE